MTGTLPPPKPLDPVPAAGLAKADHDLLVPGARDYFTSAVQEYAEMLFAEAKNIEEMEHEGSGPAEITAAHVEEAKWVLRRRQRRRTAHGKLVAVVRVAQVAMVTLVGIGASNLKDTWGTALTVGGILVAAVLLIAEREMTRD